MNVFEVKKIIETKTKSLFEKNSKWDLCYFLVALCTCVISLGAIRSVDASPISFTYTGVGSGSIDGTLFTNAEFVISATGDTDDRRIITSSVTSGFFITNSISSIDISGVGTFKFITNSTTAVNNTRSKIVLGRPDIHRALIMSETDSVFSSWNMLSSVGPITGPGSVLQWTDSLFNTDGGVLILNNNITSLTFAATVSAVPLPNAVWLLGSGLLALIGVARKKKTACTIIKYE